MIATMVAVGVSDGSGVAVCRDPGVSVAGADAAVAAAVFDARGAHPAVTIKIKTKIADTFRIPACTSLGFHKGGFAVMGVSLP
jgi:hypothetical protein